MTAPVPPVWEGASAPRVSLVTMGCAKNEVDSAAMARALAEAGYQVDAPADKADVIIVNTCSFIQSATEESLEAIFEAASLPLVAAGRASVVVAGCMPARYGDDLEGELTEAAAFVPCSKEDDIVAVLGSLTGFEPTAGEPAGTALEQPAGPTAPGEGGTFAYVKISDGCDRLCSYCTIPAIRGRYHSFPFETIRADVAREVDQGAREIVLIAQDTGRWGQDLPEGRDLAWLVDTLAEAFPDIWLRAMNRAGSAEKFAALIGRIRAAVPDITLRTTLIAGFPGETEEQFEALCDFVAEAPFDYIGVFPYSREEGTAAAELPDQLDEDEKAERAQILRDLADAVCGPRIAERIGRPMAVLVEGAEEDGQLFGRAQCQAPEVDGVTYVSDGAIGTVVDTVIADTLLYEMEGA